MKTLIQKIKDWWEKPITLVHWKTTVTEKYENGKRVTVTETRFE